MIEEEIAQHLSDLLSQRTHRLKITVDDRIAGNPGIDAQPPILGKGDAVHLTWENGISVEFAYDDDKDGVLVLRVIFRNDPTC